MRTQSEIFKAVQRTMMPCKPVAPAEVDISRCYRGNASPYGVGIRKHGSKYNPFMASVYRDGIVTYIGAFPTAAAAKQGQRDAYAGLPLRSGTKAGQVI